MEKRFYFVDEANIKGDCVEIVYQVVGDDVEQWHEGNISLDKLRAYVEKEGLNQYCSDTCQCGEHVQKTGVIPVDIFLADWENRQFAIQEYLRDNGNVIL